MGKPTGFIEYARVKSPYRPIEERRLDWREAALPVAEADLVREGARCMDCGVPFCHSLGCPVVNLIPEWNDAIYRGNWREAWERLEMTNNFPEATGRVCPAPCEASCTLSINVSPVSIKNIERAIIEKAFAEGWVTPRPPRRESGRRIAVIGSGPAGLAAAQQLRRSGHSVSLFEKADRIGGLLRYGIPDFKMEKSVLDRRLVQLAGEGVEFETGLVIGEDVSARYLRRKFDVVVLAMGAGQPRDLQVPGRGYEGVVFAMDFLTLSNKVINGEIADPPPISARDKRVLVIGGGDTGADCVGTAVRQGARKITQIEILPKPLVWDRPTNPSWPFWPNILRTSSSHEEGCERQWSVSTTRFSGGYDATVQRAHCAQVEWKAAPGKRPEPVEVPGSDFVIDVDLVLLAMGFVHVEHGRLVQDLGVGLDARGNIQTDSSYMTTVPGVFAAGDAHAGASLVVRAINHGRRAAAAVDAYLS
jgi:glutamate synthase (NADPH/NADH) small chain